MQIDALSAAAGPTSVEGEPSASHAGAHGDDELPSLEPGTVLGGRYQIQRRIGVGGMAEIYAASQFQIGAELALKLMRADLDLPEQQLATRFLSEARAVASISHPNVVRVFDYGKTPDGRPFMVMERLTGSDLDQHLQDVGRIEPKRALPWLLQVANALEAVHAQGVVHADIKPQNIFLCHGGDQPTRVKLLDFGLARRLGSENTAPEMTGTPGFMAPEQVRGDAVDPRTDIHAFGALVFTILTGHCAFDLESWFEEVRGGRTPPPKALDLRTLLASRSLNPRRTSSTGGLERVLHKAMAQDPGDRYQCIAEMTAALREATSDFSPTRSR